MYISFIGRYENIEIYIIGRSGGTPYCVKLLQQTLHKAFASLLCFCSSFAETILIVINNCMQVYGLPPTPPGEGGDV